MNSLHTIQPTESEDDRLVLDAMTYSNPDYDFKIENGELYEKDKNRPGARWTEDGTVKYWLGTWTIRNYKDQKGLT